MKNIDVVEGFDRAFFEAEIVPAYKPVVFKGAVSDWPLANFAGQSHASLMGFLEARSTPGKVWVVEAPRTRDGRFFYSDDLRGFNFERIVTTFENFSHRLQRYAGDLQAPALSIQSAFLDEYFYELRDTHPIPLFSSDARPRIWIGNRSVVATHYDDSENVACVAAGERRFTLFPPEQIENLYVGPLDRTPAGAPVSMASLTPPDFNRFPKLEQAMVHAMVAELGPGDAIYIPALWWHHVEALSDINILVNFWSGGSIAGKPGPAPLDALLLGLLTLQSKPAHIKSAWRSFFDYYVFEESVSPSDHLPDVLKGVLGGIDETASAQLKNHLIKKLSLKEGD